MPLGSFILRRQVETEVSKGARGDLDQALATSPEDLDLQNLDQRDSDLNHSVPCVG